MTEEHLHKGETSQEEDVRHNIIALVVRAFIHADHDSLVAKQELTDLGLDISEINPQTMLKSQIVTELLNQLEIKNEK